jgi:transposase
VPTGTRYPREMRERAVRMVVEHRDEYPTEWAALGSIASKLGMTPETLRKWLRRDQVDSGRRPGVTTSERERIRQLEREVRELRRANEILKAASIFFAGELDPRRPKL